MKRQLSFAIPLSVRRAYEEAVRCEDAKAWTATAVMVGTAVEAICKDFDHSSTSIAEGLKRMRDAGAISQELFEWGNGLRHLRNEGAHAAPTNVSAADAAFAVDFVQALIEILFDLRERFEAWQEDRADRAAKKIAAAEKRAARAPVGTTEPAPVDPKVEPRAG
jgi:hypothetical protein